MALSPTPFCSHCNVNASSTKQLFLCPTCKVVYYCNRNHQIAHRKRHEQACNAIKQSQQVLNRAEALLRSHPGDFETPPNPFENYVGRFGGTLLTRDYIIDRQVLVDAILNVRTYAAVEAAHGHCMDISRLCRNEDTAARHKLPALKLRLGKDQECYDFCKWWATGDDDGPYDLRDMSNPYLDVKDADAFEGPQIIFIKDSGDLNLCVAVTLLKIRLLMHVRDLQNASAIGKNVPREILDGIRSQLVSGSIVAENRDIMNSQDQTALIVNLEVQIEELHKAVDHMNKYFWSALLDPNEHLNAHPRSDRKGSVEEMQFVLRDCYFAWTETPGAIDMVRLLELNSKTRGLLK